MTDKTQAALDVIDKFIDARNEKINFLPEKTHKNQSEWLNHFTHCVNYRLSFNDWMRLDKIRTALTEAAELKTQIKSLSEIIDSQKQTHDALIKMNKELLGALKHLRHNIKVLGIKSSDLGLAMDFANESIARAEKGQ